MDERKVLFVLALLGRGGQSGAKKVQVGCYLSSH